jgi:hypothetical protein
MGNREGWDKTKTIRQLKQIRNVAKLAINHDRLVLTPGLRLDDELLRAMRRAYSIAGKQLEQLGHPEAESTADAV